MEAVYSKALRYDRCTHKHKPYDPKIRHRKNGLKATKCWQLANGHAAAKPAGRWVRAQARRPGIKSGKQPKIAGFFSGK